MVEQQKRSARKFGECKSQENALKNWSVFALSEVEEKLERRSFKCGPKTIEKPAGNPRVMPLIPQTIKRHVAMIASSAATKH